MDAILFCVVTILALWAGHVLVLWIRKGKRSSSPSSTPSSSTPSPMLPPGPFAFPVVGNLVQVIANSGNGRHRYLAALAKRHGPVFTLRFGFTPVVVVSSAGLARTVLQSEDKKFASRPTFLNARILMGNNDGGGGGEKMVVLLPYGDEWRKVRKLYLHQLFTPRRIADFQSEIITPEIRRLVRDTLVPASDAQQPVDLSAVLQKLVEDIIWRIVLRRRHRRHRPPTASSNRDQTAADRSTKDNVVDDDDGDADDGDDDGGDADGAAPAALTRLVRELAALFGAPLVGEFLPFLAFLDHGKNASMRKWNALFDEFLDGIIAERERDPALTPDASPDILDTLLLPENKLSKGAVKGLIMELFTAGSETMSLSVVWAMLELVSNPRVAEKLRNELDAVVGRANAVDFSHLPRLPYLRAVVKETMRMHPPLPLLFPHLCIDECGDLGGYVIPVGTRVFVNVWAIGRDPEVWKDHDPDTFVPERFLGDASRESMDVRGQHFEIIPFGSGRRMCPGFNLALPTVEFTLAILLHTFDAWDIPPGHQRSLNTSGDEVRGFLCVPANPVILVPRKKPIVS